MRQIRPRVLPYEFVLTKQLPRAVVICRAVCRSVGLWAVYCTSPIAEMPLGARCSDGSNYQPSGVFITLGVVDI